MFRAHWKFFALAGGWVLLVGRRPLVAFLLLAGVVGVLGFRWVRRRYSLAGAEGEPRPTPRELLAAWWREVRRRVYLSGQWLVACHANRLLSKEKQPPRLFQVQGTHAGDLTARISSGRIGVYPDDIAKAAGRIARTVGCREVTVRETAPGCADISFLWSNPLHRTLPVAELPPAPRGMVAYGVRASGKVAYVRQDHSLLIGGLTGQGKSSLVWALLADLVRQEVPVDLYVSDPKGGIELAALRKHVGERMGTLRVVEYEPDPASTVKMVEHAFNAMKARQARQQGRKHTPSKDEPLTIVLLDELLPLTAMLKQGTSGKLGQILYTGRATGFVVWANTQIGHASTLGDVRNLFPQRVCFATPTAETTDTILGTSSEARGGACSQLDRRRDMGVGYSSDETGSLAKFRAAFVSDTRTDGVTDLERIAAGRLPLGMRRDVVERTALYRLHNAAGELLYVGVSNAPRRRFREHSVEKLWWSQVDHDRTRIQWFDSEAEALAAEKSAIREELPRENTAHNQWNPLARRLRRVEVGPEPTESAHWNSVSVPVPAYRGRSEAWGSE